MLTLEPIYATFDQDLRRFVARRVDNPAAVDDLLQDIYLRIHTHLPGLRDDARLAGWVFQIARNVIIDHYRRQRPTSDLLETLPSSDELEDDTAQRLAASLARMVDCLPAKYREALVLTDLQGLSQPALAERLGLSVSGAKSRVQRGRERLKAMLLDCCHVELDRTGQVLSYEARCPACAAPDYFTPPSLDANDAPGSACATDGCD